MSKRKTNSVKPIPQLPDKEVLSEILKAWNEGYLLPSKKINKKFTSGAFDQSHIEELAKYGERAQKYDYFKDDRWIYGVSATNKDHQSFYGQFDLKHKALVTIEEINYK